jgi:dynein heavy chain 1
MSGEYSNVTADAVYNSSRACGPLWQWAEAQLEYSRIAIQVRPLREEVEVLQGVSEGILLQKNRADETISTLGADIERFKEEYATAIRDIDSIKMEMDSVHSKVFRAEHLLSSLSNEEERWKERESKFDSHLKTLLATHYSQPRL